MPRQVVANPYIKSTATTEPSLPSSPPKRSKRRPLLSPIEVGLDDIFCAVSVIDLDADSDRAFNIDEDSAADEGAVHLGSVLPSIEYSDRLCDEAHTDCLHHQWGVPQPRLNQALAFRHLADPSRPQTLLLAERTGGGKTHVTRVIGTVPPCAVHRPTRQVQGGESRLWND